MISNAQEIFDFIGPEQAADKQQRLSAQVITETDPEFNPSLVCGLDAAYDGNMAVAVAIVWDSVSHNVVEKSRHRGSVSLDYRPGFFAFREGILLVEAIARLKSNPGVFLADGHGIAHPRRFGLACHIGLAIDRPSIGVAKPHFYGTTKGEDILDANGEIIGRLLVGTKRKKCYVSVGHKISLSKAVEVVQACAVDNYPIPLQIAHSEALRLREKN